MKGREVEKFNHQILTWETSLKICISYKSVNQDRNSYKTGVNMKKSSKSWFMTTIHTHKHTTECWIDYKKAFLLHFIRDFMFEMWKTITSNLNGFWLLCFCWGVIVWNTLENDGKLELKTGKLTSLVWIWHSFCATTGV